MRIIWSEIAQATFVRFMTDQAGMTAVNRAVEALADDPAPLGAFVRGAYRRLRVGPYQFVRIGLSLVPGPLSGTRHRSPARYPRQWTRPKRGRRPARRSKRG